MQEHPLPAPATACSLPAPIREKPSLHGLRSLHSAMLGAPAHLPREMCARQPATVPKWPAHLRQVQPGPSLSGEYSPTRECPFEVEPACVSGGPLLSKVLTSER